GRPLGARLAPARPLPSSLRALRVLGLGTAGGGRPPSGPRGIGGRRGRSRSRDRRSCTAGGGGVRWRSSWLSARRPAGATPGWVPRARFTAPDGCDVAAAIAEALPSADDVRSMAFDGPKQWMSHDDYRRCADRARILHDDSLAVLATDLAEPAEKGLATGEFNVG